MCLVCILIWEKPVKKEAMLRVHSAKAGAAKTQGFLDEWVGEGSRAKDPSLVTSSRSSLSLVL